MGKFKIGDLVTVMSTCGEGSCCSTCDIGRTGIVTRIDAASFHAIRISYTDSDDEQEWLSSNALELTTNISNHEITKQTEKNPMNNVTPNDIKNLELSDDDRLLLEAAIINSEGDLTAQGHDIVIRKAFFEHRDAIIADVKKVKAAKEKK